MGQSINDTRREQNLGSQQPRRKTTARSNSKSLAPKDHSAPEVELAVDAPETGVEFYSSPDGAVSLQVRFDGETV